MHFTAPFDQPWIRDYHNFLGTRVAGALVSNGHGGWRLVRGWGGGGDQDPLCAAAEQGDAVEAELVPQGDHHQHRHVQAQQRHQHQVRGQLHPAPDTSTALALICVQLCTSLVLIRSFFIFNSSFLNSPKITSETSCLFLHFTIIQF